MPWFCFCFWYVDCLATENPYMNSGENACRIGSRLNLIFLGRSVFPAEIMGQACMCVLCKVLAPTSPGRNPPERVCAQILQGGSWVSLCALAVSCLLLWQQQLNLFIFQFFVTKHGASFHPFPYHMDYDGSIWLLLHPKVTLELHKYHWLGVWFCTCAQRQPRIYLCTRRHQRSHPK